MWKKIADEMQKYSYIYTWDQIQNKWKILLRTYKSIKDHNNITGRNRKRWQFFEKIDELMAKSPSIVPTVVIHNGRSINVSESLESPEDTTVWRPQKIVEVLHQSRGVPSAENENHLYNQKH